METIFISYSQKDRTWLEMVETRLRIVSLNMDGEVDLGVWDDQQLEAGDDWESVLGAALARAGIAVLLVSNNFLASRFVRTRELPYLRRRHLEEDGLKVIPVICELCPWKEDAFLNSLQVVADGAGLSGSDPFHRDQALNELYEKVSKLVRARLGRQEPRPPLPKGPAPGPGPAPPALAAVESLHTLEATLRHQNGEYYQVLLRLADPFNSANSRELQYKTRLPPVPALGRDPPPGLAGGLFDRLVPAGPALALVDHTAEVLGAAGAGVPLRLRIAIEPNASELHLVPWELLLQAPELRSRLAGRPVLFSRYAAATYESWPPPWMRAFPRRMAIKILASFGPAHRARAETLRQALAVGVDADIEPTAADSPLTLQAIRAQVVILLPELVCDDEECRLRFVDHAGAVTVETMEGLGERLGRQHSPQQILILDGGDPGETLPGDPGGRPLVELATRLIASGVCAVATWQSPLADARWIEFLTRFLSAFRDTGNVAQAEGAARAALPEADAWRPLVLHRLRTGQAWYRPMVGELMQDRWQLIEDRIAQGEVIPIVGPQISDYFMRSRRQIAQVLAAQCRFPLAPYERSNLQKVAQYTDTTEDRRKLERRFMLAARDYAARRLALELPVPDSPGATREVMDRVWTRIVENGEESEPIRLLARLRCPLYLTTEFHDFLSRALARELGAGGERVRDRIWTLTDRRGILRLEEDADESRFELSRTNPQVHHLFGRYDYPRSLAFTEDDYIRFLLNFKDRWKALPRRLVERFNDSALLFLGFDLEDWDFRVLFRAILELENSDLLKDIPHVAVQISPDDEHLDDPERTHRYLLDYFKQISEKPVIFVGSAQDFLARVSGLPAG